MNRLTLTLLGLLLATQASAFDPEAELRRIATGVADAAEQSFETAQDNGKSLSEAVESVRSRGNVERIVSAQTRVENGREVHHIRYMTKDGKVRTAKVPGRRLR